MQQQKKQSFMMNVGIILFAQILVKVLGMVYRMVITNIDGFGDAGNGFYSTGYQVYILLLALSSVGIPTAIAKMVAEVREKGNLQLAHQIFKVALGLFGVIGLGLSLLLFFGADFIARQVIQMEGVQLTLKALAPSIFFVCVSSVINGYFQGMQNMKSTGTAQVLEQVVKCTLTILFVALAAGGQPEILAALATTATTLSTISSFCYVTVFYRKKSEKVDKTPISFAAVKQLSKRILWIALPFSLGSIVTAVNRLIDTATITRGIKSAFLNGIPAVFGGHTIPLPNAIQLNDEAVRLTGILSKSDTLINLPLAVNVALATVLVPAITAAVTRGDKKEEREKISLSMLLSVLVVVPCALGFVALGQPIYRLIYPAATEGFELLQLSAVALVFMALNQTMYGILQGMGRIYLPAVSLIAGCTVKIILNILLIRIPSIHIYGAVISSIACQLVSFFICLYPLRHSLQLQPVKHLVKPLAAGLCMGGAAFGIYQGLYAVLQSNLIALLAAMLGAVLVYFGLVATMGILSREEYKLIPGGEKLYTLLHRKEG